MTTQTETPVVNTNVINMDVEKGQESSQDYSRRAQWLRAAVLGANDGLVSVSSLILGVGAVRQDVRAMLLAGFAGLVAGACSMAIGEYVSVHTQLDVEVAQMRRSGSGEGRGKELPRPVQAALASALAFAVGAVLPLLAAGFVREYWVRIGVVLGVATLALAGFGWLGAALGGCPVLRSAGRVVVGGWLAMALTFGLTRLIGSKGLGMM